DPALQPAAVEGRVLGFGAQGRRVDDDRRAGAEQDQVGGGALGQDAGVETQHGGWAGGQGAQDVQQVPAVVVVRRQGGGQQGLQTHGAGRGLGEGAALVLGRGGGVGRGDDVDQTVANGLDQGLTVGFGTQRR